MAAADQLDHLDRALRENFSSQYEWIYNMGTLQSREGRRFALMVHTVNSPVLSFIPFTLIPIVDFDARPLVLLLLIDLDEHAIYGFERTMDRFDLATFSSSTDDGRVEVTRHDDPQWGVVSTLHVAGTAHTGEEIAVHLAIGSPKPRALFGSNRGWVDNGALGKTLYVSRTGRNLIADSRPYLRIGTQTFALSCGTFWEDHQIVHIDLFRRSVLWNWFAAQLSDGTELMFYRLEDSATQEVYRAIGERVLGDGSTTPIEDVEMEETAHMDSDGYTVPYRWKLRAPSIGLDVEAEHRFHAPWLKIRRGMISGRMLEGPATVTGRCELAPIELLWVEHFNARHFGIEWL